MKRKIFLLTIDVHVDVETIEASFEYDPDSAEFRDFEDDVLDALDVRGYELEDEMYSNRDGSKSRYYMFTKVNGNELLEVLVKLRVSDHVAPERMTKDGQVIRQRDLSEQFTKDYAKKLVEQKYPNSVKYRIKNITILFNGIDYNSYEDALQAIVQKVDSIK